MAHGAGLTHGPGVAVDVTDGPPDRTDAYVL